MSAKTRRQFAAFREERGLPPPPPTLPPPASLPADLREKARQIREMASWMLSEADALERTAQRMEPDPCPPSSYAVPSPSSSSLSSPLTPGEVTLLATW